jgi:hypothetical protein
MLQRFALSVFAAGSLVACSMPPAPPGDGGSDAAVDVRTGPSTSVTINEIRATDEDWIELYNNGPNSVDLSDWGVTDSETSGAPKLSNVARFPAGTSLAAGQFVVVLVDQADAGAGPQMRCLSDAGPMTCYHGSFGISASRGETVHLVAPGNAVSESATYPISAAATGESWGRLPNGTGAFARNRLTPGALNLAP